MFDYVLSAGPGPAAAEETIPITRTAINNSAFRIHGSRVSKRPLLLGDGNGRKKIK